MVARHVAWLGAAVSFVFVAFTTPPRTASATVVWAIDDGERIARDQTGSLLQVGAGNPVWRPGQAIRLLAMRDEVVAFQIVVQADDQPLRGVTVDVTLPGATAERFVEHFFEIAHTSSAPGHDYAIGWAPGSGPPPGRYIGMVPDPLIPVEIAPAWAPYPLVIAAHQNGLVWVDLTVPRDQPAGHYRGAVLVHAGELAVTLPLELEVLDATLPPRPVKTMLFYERSDLERRIGHGAAVELELWRLLHRARLTPIHSVNSPDDVRAQLPALTGEAYATAGGQGDDVIVLGMYGSLGDPTAAALTKVEAIADELAAHDLFAHADVVLYAEDEDCASPRGAGWKARLAGSANANARRVRVTWTCSDDPARQPVDVPIVIAGSYDAKRAHAAQAAGKETWIYAGYRPATGTMLTDTEAVSLRTFGWIAKMAPIARWFLWQTTYWYDENPGGTGPYDPFVTTETYHNRDGEGSMGDGVLLYPGRQIDRYAEHSLGVDTVLPSIRLDNLRRGVEDAGYYDLAHAVNPAATERIARELLPCILSESPAGAQPSWSPHGQAFFQARRALADVIAGQDHPGPAVLPALCAFRAHPRAPWRKRTIALLVGIGAGLLAGTVVLARRRLRRTRAPA